MATLLSRSTWAKISVFRKKNPMFLLQNVFLLNFLARIRPQRLRIDLCAKFQLHWTKDTGTRILIWNDIKNGLMTAYLSPSDDISKLFVSEYHHNKFGFNWTTDKGETGGGGEGAQCAPPSLYGSKKPQPE